MTDQIMLDEYEAFVEKFKPKKTTDDCYTPPKVYDAIAEWVCREYGIERERTVRPFYPGGDYENFHYEPETVVLDNPPFSILTRIVDFYCANGIRFFLFAPTLTILSTTREKACAVIVDEKITYENGAVVNTSFVTNLEKCLVRTAPALKRAIHEAQKKKTVKPPKYDYPPNVLNATMVNRIADMDFRVEDGFFIRQLDSQRKAKRRFSAADCLSRIRKQRRRQQRRRRTFGSCRSGSGRLSHY